ncbi:MAG: alpha/beta hydrolase [Ilumatobacteraceae bacterium]
MKRAHGGILGYVSIVGAILLLFVGLAGLLASWNAARPLIDPTRRYSPSWLPAMVITELAPFWLLVHGALLVLGLAIGGGSNLGGLSGAWMIVASMMLLTVILVRTTMSVRRLRRRVDGEVHGVSGRANLIGRPVPVPPGVTELLGVEWADGLTCDITRPSGKDRALPVVVYVHGGGWTSGDPQRQGRDMYHALALAGWATVAIRYPFTPTVSVERQIETVTSAVRWVRTAHAEHGIDATEVVLAGGSAGAHLAAMTALDAAPHDRVAACIGLYGIYDMANRNHCRARWDMIRNRVMMQTVADAPARYDAVSPLCRITDESPPMLIVHGTRDTLVPIGEAEQFVAALREAGRPVEFVRVDGAQHAFDGVSSPLSRTVAAVIRTWVTTQVLGERTVSAE